MESAQNNRRLIVRSTDPNQIETGLDQLGESITPNDSFFVRDHLRPPLIDPDSWRLEVSGSVGRHSTLSLAELLKHFEAVRLTATLQCSGNGRAFFSPLPPGAAWEHGAIGNATWTGVRLRDLLNKVQPQAGAGHLQFEAFDEPFGPNEPRWVRSLPLARAMDPTTLLAFEMNGQPLPTEHGGPVRLVVPQWSGNHWCKWVARVTVQPHESSGYFMHSAYRAPGSLTGVDAVTEDDEHITVMPVGSLIVSPLNGAGLAPGINLVTGFALTGIGAVRRVELSITATGTRDPKWIDAKLEPQQAPGAWQRWSYQWNERTAGSFEIRARAHDSAGRVQPETTLWNHAGYLWNGIHRTTCAIG